ncbi:MAG: GHKL domain-containing protein [Azonexus sp.]|jgi:C4-dicarboxylate-specific signal transduction histidine kinase|nr:GHKL domain-containing protein [Azonexus sp.]
MSRKTRPIVDYALPGLWLDRLGRRGSLLLAGTLMLLIGLIDCRSDFTLRLSALYLLPVAIAAWTDGRRGGVAAAAIASLLWLTGFNLGDFAGRDAVYLLEASGTLGSFALVVWLVVRLRRALSQAEDRFVRMLEGVGAAVYVVDEERQRLLYANPEMERIDSRLSEIGPRVFEEQFASEPTGGDVSQPASGLASNPLRHSATGRWYRLLEGVIPWGKRRHVKLKVLNDVTEQKSAQMLREQRRESVHQASRVSALAEIASTLAHEINQPLMVIATYTDACQRLLQTPEVDREEIITVLGRCHDQAMRASSIIERLREFIRQRQHQPALWPVLALVAEVLDVCRPLLEEVRVGVDSSQVDGALVIVGDRVLLVQLLVNLIRNAIDAMRAVPENQRRLTIAATRETDVNVLISVADRGSGLSIEDTETLFKPFYTTKGEGLGLGLAICRSIAESHKGRLWASGNAEGGATFYLTIPADTSAEAAAA